jgi:Tfp pilus assembly protein PilN
MVVIDLLPADEARAALTARRRRVAALAAGALVASVLIVGHAAIERATATAHRQAAAVDVALGALHRPAAALRRLRARREQLARRLAVIHDLEARGRTLLAALDAVSDALPQGAWLTELTVADGRLRVAGVARDDRLIVAFVAGLRAATALRGIDLEEASGVTGGAADGGQDRSARRFVVAGGLGAEA